MLNRITLTFAQSLDGKIATSSGESRYISEEASLELNQRLRRDHDALIVGIGTVLADNPMLNCRIDPEKSPMRVILDSSLRIPAEGNIVKTSKENKTIVFYSRKILENRKDPSFLSRISYLEQKSIIVKAVPEYPDGFLNLEKVLEELEKLGIHSVMVEEVPPCSLHF